MTEKEDGPGLPRVRLRTIVYIAVREGAEGLFIDLDSTTFSREQTEQRAKRDPSSKVWHRRNPVNRIGVFELREVKS